MTDNIKQHLTPEEVDLWAEGLEQAVRPALRRAQDAGVPKAAEAIANVEARGPRGVVVREIVLRLGRELDDHANGDLRKMGFQPWRPGFRWMAQQIE